MKQKEILRALSLGALFFVVGNPPLFGAAAGWEAHFKEANAKYEAGDFKKAASLYEEMIQGDAADAPVYYNLGNAYFRQRRIGKAILSYERALRVAPRDKDIRWNLQMAERLRADRIQPKRLRFFHAWLKQAAAYFTVNEVSLLWSLVLAVWLLALFFGRKRPGAGAVRALPSGIFVLWLGLTVFFAVKWAEVKEPRAVVVEPQVYLRYGPSEKERKAYLLHEGTKGKVRDRSREWIYLVLENGNAGWLLKESCEVI